MSLDLPLGGPFNIASYSILTHMVAQAVDMDPGKFIWSTGDTHVYEDQFDAVCQQVIRKDDLKPFPIITLKNRGQSIFEYEYEDFTLEGYDPHPAIKFPNAAV